MEILELIFGDQEFCFCRCDEWLWHKYFILTRIQHVIIPLKMQLRFINRFESELKVRTLPRPPSCPWTCSWPWSWPWTQQSCGDAEGGIWYSLINSTLKEAIKIMGAESATEFIRTLSKREIFMAFIVAESTSIGGPSSNTSLMNSLPWLRTSATRY